MTEKTELEKAIETVENANYAVVRPFTFAAKPYIGELSVLLESGGYRLDGAQVERDESTKATGRIMLTVFPLQIVKRLEKEGGC